MEVSQSQKDLAQITSPVCIVAECHVGDIMDQFVALSKAHKSDLFEGIINPSKLRGFTRELVDCRFGIKHRKTVGTEEI